MDTYTILVIEAYKTSVSKAVSKLTKSYPELGIPKIVLLTSQPEKYQKTTDIEVIATDYSDESLSTVLMPYQDSIKAVICRGDKYVQFLRKVIPYLPAGVFVSSESSLEAATNKRLMRQAFTEKYPEITPRFVKIKDASIETIDLIEQKVDYPVVVKPASLASSLMIQRCDNRVQLTSALKQTFTKLETIYKDEERHEPAEVIVESYLEGELYSVDSYVRDPGTIDHCPPVRYISANQMGIDDFFLYKRWVPVELSEQELNDMYQAVEKAVDAIGLQFSSTHTELIKTNDGWKIIELGPRLGRFRNILYREAYDIDHGYNDILTHLNKPPIVNDTLLASCAAYSIYPTEEGILKAVSRLSDVSENVKSRIVYQHAEFTIGQNVKHAKNGGHALVEIIIANDNPEQFAIDCQWIEQNVKAEVSRSTV